MGLYYCDREGDPVFINDVSGTDFDALLDVCTVEEIEVFLVMYFQRILNIAFPLSS